MGSKDLSKLFKGLSVKNKSDVYILLLGQKSIGKSTFINTLSNCLIFDKLKDARAELIRVLLPCRLSIKDKSSSCHLVKIGTDDDVDDSEAFLTKQIKTYVIPLNQDGSSKLHIIDTPGFEGPNGFDQDKRLCDDILTYIAPLQEVHAICWFLSPTDLKITSFFDYCVKIILPRIDKRSYDSLVFCFSKTRDFTSGEAWLNLEKAIKSFNATSDNKIKWSTSHDNDNNIFCFENDFFRYLAGIKLGYSMDATIHSSSWEHSAREMKRMLSYIMEKSKSVPLKNSTCINEGKRLIITISQPLFDMLQFIQEQTCLLETHKRDLMSGAECLTDLKQKLYFPIVNLDAMSSGQPYLVCSSNKCIQFYMDWGTNRWELPKQKCHDKCYLSRSPSHMVGGSELMECEKIDNSLQLCKKCTCHYSSHLHLYYSLKWSLQKTKYTTAEPGTPSEILSVLEKLRGDMDKLIGVYNQQKLEIVINLAQFAHFMENTSIISHVCCYDDYFETLIHRLKNVLLMPDPEVKTQLLNLQSFYREKKRDYDTALDLQKRLNNDPNLIITPQKIMENVVKIYNLGEIGKKIKQLMKIQKTARQNEQEQSIVNLLQINQKVQKDKSNEAKKDKKESKNKKKTSSSSDSDNDTSLKENKSKVNEKKPYANQKASVTSEKPKSNKNLEKKNKNNLVDSNKEKVKQPSTINKASTSTATGGPNKKGTGTKPFKKDKFYPKVPPPSYESVINQGGPHAGMNNPHQAQPHTIPPGAVGHAQSPTVEVKVYNNPHAPGNVSVHGSASFPSHSHGPWPHGSVAHESLAHGSLPHGSLAHGSLAHGPVAHGSMSHGQLPHRPVFMPGPPSQQPYYGAPSHTSTHSQGYHGSYPQSHPHPLHSAVSPPSYFDYYGYQGIEQHGHGGPNQQASFKYSTGLGKDKPNEKKDHKKFKRDCKRKIKKDKPKKEQVKKKVSDSSSSSSSDSD